MANRKRCETCGNPFTAIRSDAKFCRPYCRLAAFRHRDELIVAKAERELKTVLGGVRVGRLTGAQARAQLALYLLDGVKIDKEIKELIKNL